MARLAYPPDRGGQDGPGEGGGSDGRRGGDGGRGARCGARRPDDLRGADRVHRHRPAAAHRRGGRAHRVRPRRGPRLRRARAARRRPDRRRPLQRRPRRRARPARRRPPLPQLAVGAWRRPGERHPPRRRPRRGGDRAAHREPARRRPARPLRRPRRPPRLPRRGRRRRHPGRRGPRRHRGRALQLGAGAPDLRRRALDPRTPPAGVRALSNDPLARIEVVADARWVPGRPSGEVPRLVLQGRRAARPRKRSTRTAAGGGAA